MALQEYVGAIVLEVDGAEIEVVSCSPTEDTGRRLVRTMNRSGNAAGFTQGVTNYELSIVAVIPKTGEAVDWANIQGAKLTISPVTEGGQRVSYLDAFSTSVGRQYQVEGEARIDVRLNALRKVVE
ncbi:MAG: phage tail protein [Aquincola sp.]|nr:phage tail protein [Aquincola sp.]